MSVPMVNINSILIFILFLSYQDRTSAQEITEKAGRIRMELLSNKPLPSAIQKPTNQAEFSSAHLERWYSFFYNTKRKEDNLIDSVKMTITVLMDSLEHLSFHEMHFKNGNEDKSYMYQVNKYGVIDWAYWTDPPTSEPTMVEKNDSVLVTPSNQPIIQINTDSANYIPKVFPIKNPDEKTMAFYTAKLVTSLDELEKILFQK